MKTLRFSFVVALSLYVQSAWAASALLKAFITYTPTNSESYTIREITQNSPPDQKLFVRKPGTVVKARLFRTPSIPAGAGVCYSFTRTVDGHLSSVCTNKSDYSFDPIVLGSGADTQVMLQIDPAGLPGYERANLLLTIRTPPTVLPDLTVAGVSVNDHSTPAASQAFQVGQQVKISGRENNSGGTASAHRLGFYLSDQANSGGNRFAYASIDKLNNGQGSYGETFYTFQPGDVGIRYFVLKADYRGEVDEENEGNNLGTWGPFQVRFPTGSLCVSALAIPGYFQGDTFKVEVSGNTATAPRSSLPICFGLPVGSHHVTLSQLSSDSEWGDYETWAVSDVQVENGSMTNLLLTRNLPLALHHEFRNVTNNAMLSIGTSVSTGTPIKVITTITNSSGSSKTVYVQHRFGPAGNPLGPTASISQEVPDLGAARFTNSFTVEVQGTYRLAYRVVSSLDQNRYTDTGNSFDALVGTEGNTVTLTLRNIDASWSSYVPQNVSWSAAGLHGDGNPTTLTGLVPGLQTIRAWQDGGTPFGREQWLETQERITIGTQALTLTRNLPFASIRVFQAGKEVMFGSKLAVGDKIVLLLTIFNPGDTARYVVPKMRMSCNFDSTQEIARDLERRLVEPAQSTAYTLDVDLGGAGTWWHAYSVETELTSASVLTDSSDWYPHFDTRPANVPSASRGDFYYSMGPASAQDVPLERRIPLILVHGLGNELRADTENYWHWWLSKLNEGEASSLFKVYRYVYDTTLPIQTSGERLASFVNSYRPLEGRSFIVLAHSMGGLVCRYAMASDPAFGERTIRLVTLATPHTGTPLANPCWFSACGLIQSGLSKWLLNPALGFFSGAQGTLDLSWCCPSDSLAGAWDDDRVNLFTHQPYNLDRGLLLSSMNSPFTANSIMQSPSHLAKLIAYGGERSNDFSDFMGGKNSVSGPANDVAESKNDHRLLQGACVVLRMMRTRSGHNFDQTDGLVPLESALFSARLPKNIQSFNLSEPAYLGKELDHSSFLDDPAVIAHVIGDLLSLTPSSPTVSSISPTSAILVAGQSTNISVQASGSPPLAYQWRFNGANLLGQTNVTLTLSRVQTNQSGEYRVVVNNSVGSATSAVAMVRVVAPPVPQLLAHYRFDGNALDQGGNGLHATVAGAQLTSDSLGIPNSAYLFNGSSSYMTIADPGSKLSFDARSQDYTVALWVRLDGALDRDHTFLADRATEDNPPSAYILNYSGSEKKFAVILWDGTTGTDKGMGAISTTSPQAGRWYHLAMTVSGKHIKLYVDGNEESNPYINSNTLPEDYGTTRNADQARSIGRYAGERYGNYLLGALDDVRIYSGALFQEEIRRLIPRVSIKLTPDHRLIITWTSGELQRTSSLLDPVWKTATGIISGVPFNIPQDATGFYRIAP